MLHKFLVRVQAYLALRGKVAEAKSLFKKDGLRRFVIPFTDGKMEVLTKQEALALKKHGDLPKDLSARTIYGACFYYTDTIVKHEHVQCEMPKYEFNRRKKSYYRWFERHHTDCV